MNAQRAALFGTASIVPSLVILLVGVIVWISLTYGPGGQLATVSLHNFSQAFTDPMAVTAITNTLLFTLMALLVAFFFGLPIAWLTERTDIGGKHAVYS